MAFFILGRLNTKVVARLSHFRHHFENFAKIMRHFIIILLLLNLCSVSAHASVGLTELPANEGSGHVTVLYPAAVAPTDLTRQSIRFPAAEDAPPVNGNGKLVVISHGSPAPVWVYLDLARALVEAGFTVILPEHFHDNASNDSEPGPPSWKRRPVEVSAAIDRIQRDPRFSNLLDFQRIGMYGMSAGGHTALTLAGGRWSPSRLRAHCGKFIGEDFHACAGPSFSLTGGTFDGLKKWMAQAIGNWKFDDPVYYAHRDPRITAVVAGVPFAADFDFSSLNSPPVALGIITARKDKWLNPKFHGDAVLAACVTCVRILDLQDGGHGALLSPLPSSAGMDGSLIADPPGFDRAKQVPQMNAAIVSFFQAHLNP